MAYSNVMEYYWSAGGVSIHKKIIYFPFLPNLFCWKKKRKNLTSIFGRHFYYALSLFVCFISLETKIILSNTGDIYSILKKGQKTKFTSVLVIKDLIFISRPKCVLAINLCFNVSFCFFFSKKDYLFVPIPPPHTHYHQKKIAESVTENSRLQRSSCRWVITVDIT